MRHVTLTCRQHPDLRWSCKEIAYTYGHGYNGARNIFFRGPGSECDCPANDLRLAPEDEDYGLDELFLQEEQELRLIRAACFWLDHTAAGQPLYPPRCVEPLLKTHGRFAANDMACVKRVYAPSPYRVEPAERVARA